MHKIVFNDRYEGKREVIAGRVDISASYVAENSAYIMTDRAGPGLVDLRQVGHPTEKFGAFVATTRFEVETLVDHETGDSVA